MALLEREHPLEVLRERAERAAAGAGQLVLVAGEAGIGKTVLLRAFAEGLARDGLLWGMCDSLSTPRPLGPLRDVAHRLGPAVTGALSGGAPPYEVFAAVLDALRERPLVLVVEDLHWADEATLDLVRFLARRISTVPLLLVLTYREALGPDHPLGPVIGELVTLPDTRRLRLVPLSQTAVRHLCAGQDLDPEQVHRRTGGNPFYVSQILDQPEARLPESVRDAVLARAAALRPEQRRTLELLSCAPEAVSGELLGALEIPAATVDALTATGLVERRGRGIAFRHEIARSAVLDAATPGSEPALHAVMIDALEATGGDPSVLAHHAAAAVDVPRLLRYAPAAAAAASRSGAHREAVAFYRSAVQHAPDADPVVRADLLERLATELYFTDRLTEAIATLERAIELRRAVGDDVAVGAAHRMLSDYAWYAGDGATANRHDEAAITILRSAGAPRELGFALANHAYLAAHRGDGDGAVDAGTDAQQIAGDLGDPALHATAAVGLSVARLYRGDLGARADLLAASDTGLRERLDELATAPMSNLAHVDVEQGRFAQADDVLTAGLRISDERDIHICSLWQRGVRARLRLLQGLWSEAEEDARAVLAGGELALGRLWPHLVLGLLAVRRGSPADASHLDEMWRIAIKLDSPVMMAATVAALAEQAWICRRPDPRLTLPAIDGLAAASFAGRDDSLRPVRLWSWRLAEAGVQQLTALSGGSAAPVATDERPYERAMAFWDRGRGDDLLAALPLLDDLGALAVAARFRERLRGLGVQGIPRGRTAPTRDNPAGLTTRQVDVLALLVEGLSNADIAHRLVISPKTADHHVSAILAKLRVSSRGEAAAAGRRLGLSV